MTLATDVQRPYVGELITLFEVDCRKFADSTVLYFTPSAHSATEVRWNGNTYIPVDIEAEGFEWNGQGAFPNPVLRLSNVTQLASALVITFEDLIGADVKRVRTLRQYLDDGATPDPGQVFGVDLYRVEQKTRHNRTTIEWKLSAAVDQEGITLPSQILARDYCSHIYRRRVNGNWDYSEATCPWEQTNVFFKSNDDPTGNADEDRCSKQLTGCKLRFGANNPLPFRGLPGLGRFRT